MCLQEGFTHLADRGLIMGEGNGFAFVICLLLVCLSARRSSSFPVCLERGKENLLLSVTAHGVGKASSEMALSHLFSRLVV